MRRFLSREIITEPNEYLITIPKIGVSGIIEGEMTRIPDYGYYYFGELINHSFTSMGPKRIITLEPNTICMPPGRGR